MLSIIKNNPYRVLGVYSNSPMKDIVSNEGKMKAFFKVGRTVNYPLDLPSLLPSIERNEEIVTNAKSQIALPEDKFRYAQFWFVKASDEDEAAFNWLFSGSIDKAIELWSQQDSAASYQNRMICYFIQEDLDNALQMVCNIYEPMDAGYFTLVNLNCMELLKLIMGEDNSVSGSGVDEHFLDTLVENYGSDVILKKMPDCILKGQLVDSISKKLISDIHNHINTSNNKNQSAKERLGTGRQLMTTTRPLLIELKKIISPTDNRYQMIADKLSLAILQCGIDYFNNSDDNSEAAPKAMTLQKYALSIAVGDLAKERCQENVNILQNIIDALPPQEVYAEDKAIKDLLSNFLNKPDEISYSVTLLNGAKPHIDKIKTKLGATNSYYLKISTQVISYALHNVIEEVNNAMNNLEQSSQTKSVPTTQDVLAVLNLRTTLQSAWNATKIMDTFDIEPSFKSRYNKNRSSLMSLCDDVGISTSSYSLSTSSKIPSTTRTTSTPARPAAAYTPSPSSSSSSHSSSTTSRSSSSSSYSSSSSSNSSEKNNGWTAFWIATIITAIIGAMANGGEGFVCGAILGALLPGQICKAIFSD